MERRNTTRQNTSLSIKNSKKKQKGNKSKKYSNHTIKKSILLLPNIPPYTPVNNFDSLDDYLTIFTTLMGTDTIYKSLKGLLDKQVIETETKDIIPSNKNCIYYFNGPVTHYRVIKNNINIDPYENYQKPNSHGFCQLFAYYIFIGKTDNLKIARRTTALTDYANNMIYIINDIHNQLTKNTQHLINYELPFVCKENEYPLILFNELVEKIKSYKLVDFIKFVVDS